MANDPKAPSVSLFKKISKLFLKILLWISGIAVALVLTLILVLRSPRVQTYLTQKAAAYLSARIKSKVTLKEINIAFPKSVVLKGLFVADLKKDTLLEIRSMELDVNLLGLFSKAIVLNDIEIESLTSHIRRLPGHTEFNFSFIPDAFASAPSDTKKQPQQKTAPWTFAIKRVGLKDIHVIYCDAQTGVNTGLVLGALTCVLDTFDLAKSKIHFESVDLKNSVASIVLLPVPALPKVASDASPFDIGFGSVSLASVKARYEDKAAGQNLSLDLGILHTDIRTFNLSATSFTADLLELSGTHFSYVSSPALPAAGNVPAGSTGPVSPATADKPHWFCGLKKLKMKDNAFFYDNKQIAVSGTGMDFNHLLFSNIQIDCTDILLSSEKITFNLAQMQVNEKSGFHLADFRTKFSMDDTHITLDQLNLQTDKSKIGPYLSASYPSLSVLRDSIGKLWVNTDLQNSSIAFSDLLLFAPDLLKQPILSRNRNAIVRLQTRIKGTLNHLQIPELELALNPTTILKLKGAVSGLPDINTTFASIDEIEIKTGKKDLAALLPEGLLPASIAVPESILIKAHLKGYLKNYDADLDLSTSFGGMKTTVRMNPAAGNSIQPYSIDLSLSNFDIGKLLEQSNVLGLVSLRLNLKGPGFDTAHLQADILATIQSARANGYVYENLVIGGKIDKKSFAGTASMDGKDLAFLFDGKIDLNSPAPKFVFTLDLKQADLAALHLSKKNLRLSGEMVTDLTQMPGRNITGRVAFRKGLLVCNNTHCRLDSILLTSEYTGDVARIRFHSATVNADFKGNILVTELPALMTEHFRTYFDLQPEKQKSHLPGQKFEFNVTINDPGVLADIFAPDLQLLLPSVIKGSYDSELKKIDLGISVPQMIYADTKLDTIKISVHSNIEKLNYSIRMSEASGSLLKVENIFLGGSVSHNVLNYQLNTLRDDSSKMISVGGTLKHTDSVLALRINPDLILNKIQWAIDTSNTIRFEKQGVSIHHLAISHGIESVSVNSINIEPTRELHISFKQFHLTSLSHIIESHDSLVKGVVDGSFVLKQKENKTGFVSDLTIGSLVYKGSLVGNVALHADNEEVADKYKVRLNLSGNQNDLTLGGYYITGTNASNLNFDLDIPNLNLASVEPFAYHQLTRMSGSLHGKLKLTGTVASPDIQGALNFDKAAMNPGIINSYLKINNASLVLDSKKIKFNHFVLTDSLNNQAVLSGFADIHDLSNVSYDVHLKTTNFLALNTTLADNPLYYGKVYLSSDISVKGDMDHPVLDIKAKLNKGSSLTYVRPDDQLANEESKGIVEFPDTLVVKIRQRTGPVAAAQASNTSAKGMDLSASIEIDRNTKLKMLVDPLSGDSLIVRGDATLDFSLDRSNKTSLTGTYTVYSGSYHLTLSEFVKRDFNLDKGSQIIWSGDVAEAYLNLSAIYKTKAAPLDLVESQLAGMSDAQKNVYRTNLDFLVYLKMKGTLENPEISFDIQQQDDQRGALNGTVDARLNQIREDQNEMNKQVFSLLTLNRFIAEDPMSSSGSGDVLSSAARSSASKLLTQQLNRASEKYVKGVDLNLGLESYDDFSTGQQQGRTQVKVGVTKQLFKDKVSVQVGGNIDVEGQKAKENNASEIAGNVLVEYKLTDDSRYKLKMFRKNEYENAIEGELTKTGIGILFTKDYNKLRQLFVRRPRKKKTKQN